MSRLTLAKTAGIALLVLLILFRRPIVAEMGRLPLDAQQVVGTLLGLLTLVLLGLVGVQFLRRSKRGARARARR